MPDQILSSVLAILRFWEFWRDRFQIDISYNFVGDPEIGNQILIRNLSGRPIILAYWELQWRRRWLPFQSVVTRMTPEHDIRDARIDPQSTYTLHFSGADYFDWGVRALKGKTIYIRLHVAGRRPILRKVYP